MTEFPASLYPSAYADLGATLTVSLSDPRNPEASIKLLVPQCKKDEALQIVQSRQQQDKEQAQKGILFKDRVYR